MKAKIVAPEETEDLLKKISKRQVEISKLTFHLIEISKQTKQNNLEVEPTFNWINSVKTNDSYLLSNVI